MKEYFQEWNPNRASAGLVQQINRILRAYKEMGYKLTLRQLYYQLVSKDIIPNTVSDYNRVGNILNKGRLAGLIDWAMIEDRIRIPQSRGHWDNPKDILESAAYSYYRDRWANQDHYIEVWCEKDAVSNIIQPVCHKYDVTFMANRGYSSQSAMYEASRRLAGKVDLDKEIHIIYIGDHDPSGIDMTRDIDDRIKLFLSRGTPSYCDVNRIALNMDQVEQYHPPENPAKMTDSRFMSYAKKYGTSSWELDALEPKVLENLVEQSITSYIEQDAWLDVVSLENVHKEKINKIAENWEEE